MTEKGATLARARSSQGTHPLVEEFTQSVSYDRVLYRQDIAGSKAHARMLAARGVISADEAGRLIRGLDAVLNEIESGSFVWSAAEEDLHMNIERRLTELAGDVGKKLHTGRSRNDQTALAFRLFVSDGIRVWRDLLRTLIAVLVDRAEQRADLIMPGFTHLQPAQPVSAAQHLLAYAWMFRRDAERLAEADGRIRVCPLGAAALAGSTFPLDPQAVAAELDMNGVFRNSMDAVSDRDFVLEALFCASLVMMHLSRLSEDIILWASPAFGFIRLPDAYSTGSSIMPQKRNPDTAELTRGKCGRVYGALLSLLTVMKGLPMTYNRDLQEDKEQFLDTDATVALSLRVMTGLLGEMVFVPEKMREALRKGFVNATELADYLAVRGVPFRDAYRAAGKAVDEAERRACGLEDLPTVVLRGIHPLLADDVREVLEYERAVARRESPGGTGPLSVRHQIAELRAGPLPGQRRIAESRAGRAAV
ncbi:MAG: argininosuccinate lyase [Desulfovibrio sp.]|jgi:argininosuccinate lyase|nr:argininosuccinate lyase [Desulfovibrio sp.]